MKRKQVKPQAQVPPTKNWEELRAAALTCKACPLWKTGTQTVFGDGARKAKLMLVGEQPGDREDIEGKPFVGPAGKILRHLLLEAGISPDEVYLTNAVKHFKWVAKGKKRIHQKPNVSEMNACHPWLMAEIQKVKPKVIVALGATAAQSILGRVAKITKERGRLLKMPETDLPLVLTWHPSSILRMQDEPQKEARRKEILKDLRLAKSKIK